MRPLPLVLLGVAIVGLALAAVFARPGRHGAQTSPPPTAAPPSSIPPVVPSPRDTDVARLCDVVRSSAPARERMTALSQLARRKDPDGRILAALRDAALAVDPKVAHKALDALAEYVEANPERCREVYAYLFDRALTGDLETRAVAAGVLRFDRLDAADDMQFARLFADPELEIRLVAAAVAGQSTTRRAESSQVLCGAFRSEGTEEVRATILAQLSEMGDRPALQSLRGVSAESDRIIEQLLKQ